MEISSAVKFARAIERLGLSEQQETFWNKNPDLLSDVFGLVLPGGLWTPWGTSGPDFEQEAQCAIVLPVKTINCDGKNPFNLWLENGFLWFYVEYVRRDNEYELVLRLLLEFRGKESEELCLCTEDYMSPWNHMSARQARTSIDFRTLVECSLDYEDGGLKSIITTQENSILKSFVRTLRRKTAIQLHCREDVLGWGWNIDLCFRYRTERTAFYRARFTLTHDYLQKRVDMSEYNET